MKVKEESNSLATLLKDTENTSFQNSGINKNAVDSMPEELEPAPLFEVDFDKIYSDLRKKARRTLNKIIRHIVPDHMLENQYVKDKMEQDILTLSGLYYQLYCNETMQKSLMETVGRGNPSPRLFETFTLLSKNIADTNKQVLQTEEVLRKTYLEIKYEVREKETESVKLIKSENNINPQLINRGSKSLIEAVKNMAAEKELNKDIEFTEVEEIE